MLALRSRSTGRLVRGFVLWGALGLIVVTGGAAVTVRGIFAASLARTSGTVIVPSLESEVTIERDGLGIPVIRGARLEDIACAVGFLHAQERFFQMDSLRRLAAGELAAAGGPVGLDRVIRRLRLRAVAETMLEEMPVRHRRRLEAYARGVNAGLDDLGARPPEYWALRKLPEPWKPEDTVLVISAMTMQLSRAPGLDQLRDEIHQSLSREMAGFILPEYTRFDAPLEGRKVYEPAPIPGPKSIDLRDRASSDVRPPSAFEADRGEVNRGSNNWAVAASRTSDGRAILASDPHLSYGVPTVWYRVQIELNDGDVARRVVGVTLPGAPMIAIGSNGKIAWGMTNVHGDFDDDIIIEVDLEDSSRYRTPGGWREFEILKETIEVAGADPVTLDVKLTQWGPVWRVDREGRPVVLRWTGSTPGLVNLDLLDMSGAQTLEEGIDVAARWWGPPQNIAIADDQGNIAMVMSGYLPERVGMDGRRPASWAKPGVGWVGSLADEDRPKIIDPDNGLVYSANARVFNEKIAAPIGANWPLGVRATRIVQMLDTGSTFDERDLFEMQLDTRVLLLEAYRELLLEHITIDDPDHDLAHAVRTLSDEELRAESESRAVAIMDAFVRETVFRMHRVIESLVQENIPEFIYWWFGDDEWVLRVLEETPSHWLDTRYESWDGWFRSCLRDAIDGMDEGGEEWGSRRPFVFHHPLSMVVPTLGVALDMPKLPGTGHVYAVRAHGRGFGASMRMIVSPGHEEDGILHMPCGQSGHFLSRHYGDMHRDWAEGRAAPLLAGDAVSSFRLVPGK